MISSHNALFKETEGSPDEILTAVGHDGRRTTRSSCGSQRSWRRRHTFSVSQTIKMPKDAMKTHSPQPARKKYSTYDTQWDGSASLEDFTDDGIKSEDKTLKAGWLYKTTRLKTSKTGHRQYRRFRLTAHSLEYSHLLQKVCVFRIII